MARTTRTTREPSDADAQEWRAVSDEIRERLRVAVARLQRREERVTISATQQIAGAQRKVVALAVRLYKAGVLPDPGTPKGGEGAWSRRVLEGTDEAGPADTGDPRALFAAALRAAQTDEQRAQLQHELAALVAAGIYSHQEANAIRQALASATSHGREARNAPDEEARRQRVYAGADAYALVRAYDGIVSDERRERILRMVAAEFAADLEEHPPIDTGRLSPLEARP